MEMHRLESGLNSSRTITGVFFYITFEFALKKQTKKKPKKKPVGLVHLPSQPKQKQNTHGSRLKTCFRIVSVQPFHLCKCSIVRFLVSFAQHPFPKSISHGAVSQQLKNSSTRSSQSKGKFLHYHQ